MEDFIREFRVYNDEGDYIFLEEYKKVIDTSTIIDTEKQKKYGLSRFVTEAGKAVKFINGGYQVLGEKKIFYEE